MTQLDKHNMISDGLEKVSAAALFLGISRSSVYKLIAQGLLPSVKIGHSRRIPIRAVRELASDRLVVPAPVLPECRDKK